MPGTAWGLSLKVSAIGFKALLYLAQLLACPSALRAYFSQKCPQFGCKMKIITLSIAGKAYGVKQERILWMVNWLRAWAGGSLSYLSEAGSLETSVFILPPIWGQHFRNVVMYHKYGRFSTGSRADTYSSCCFHQSLINDWPMSGRLKTSHPQIFLCNLS